jgi:ribosomal protein L11 methyltransferase
MSSVLGTSAGLGEGAGHCKTYILQQDYMVNNIENELNNIFSLHNLKYYKSTIKEENWNAVWESNFEPVRVGDFVGIRANFHPSFDPKVQYEIQITPKMSFGTGHHATTFTVMQLMKNLDFRGKSVYDFGTGTGILAILAEMLGASEVLAVDNDPWCIENSEENLQANGSSKITIQLVDAAFQPRDFDIIIANVNRHIIEANLEALSQVSNSTSTLILSGLLIEDQDDIISLAQKNNWQFIQSQPLDGWVSLLFNKA